MAPENKIILEPNIGGEEIHRQDQNMTHYPVVMHLSQLWHQSFGPAATLLDFNNPPSPTAHWEWLPEGPGLLPWLATPFTESRAKKLGLQHLGPQAAHVAIVHDKGFACETAKKIQHQEGWEFSHVLGPIQEPTEAEETLKGIVANWPSWAQDNFTIKPRMGSSGRGRIAGKRGIIGTQHIQGLTKMSSRAGAIVEPWYSTISNMSTQLLISPTGDHRIIGHTSQVLTDSGTYLGNHGTLSQGIPGSNTSFDTTLTSIAQAIAPLIALKGFTGPCGFDAFSFHCSVSNEIRLRAPLEINARFTSAMVGLGHMHAFATTQKIEDGSWLFLLDAQDSWCRDAQTNSLWKSKTLESSNTGKRALIVLSTEKNAIRRWLEAIGLKP